MSLRMAGVTGLSFEGRGERIARGFYIPVLKESVEYDRATGYFSVESLVHAAGGVAELIGNGGRMRLILGAHDVSKELWEAYTRACVLQRLFGRCIARFSFKLPEKPKHLQIGCILDVDDVDVYEVELPLRKGEKYAEVLFTRARR